MKRSKKTKSKHLKQLKQIIPEKEQKRLRNLFGITQGIIESGAVSAVKENELQSLCDSVMPILFPESSEKDFTEQYSSVEDSAEALRNFGRSIPDAFDL